MVIQSNLRIDAPPTHAGMMAGVLAGFPAITIDKVPVALAVADGPGNRIRITAGLDWPEHGALQVTQTVPAALFACLPKPLFIEAVAMLLSAIRGSLLALLREKGL